MSVTIHQLLKTLVDQGGRTFTSPPTHLQIRIDGKMIPLQLPPMTASETKQLIYSVLTDAQKGRFEEKLEHDFSFGVKGLARFRANIFFQAPWPRAFRTIPWEIRSFRDLGLPDVVTTLCERPRGLVLVTGPTGSGKSTTLAAMLDKINAERHEHIVTIEDPIQYLHSHKKCVVNQRELHADTLLPNALRSALRQDPDVVLIGEMRDLETIESSPADRRDGPPHLRHPAHQLGVADHQPHHRRLPAPPAVAGAGPALPGTGGDPLPVAAPRANGHGRVLAMEILVPNSAIRNLIREDKVHQIYSAMQVGQGKFGMQTFNQSLASLYFRKLITQQVALSMSSNPDELQDMMNRGAGRCPCRRPAAAAAAAGGRPRRRSDGESQEEGSPCRTTAGRAGPAPARRRRGCWSPRARTRSSPPCASSRSSSPPSPRRKEFALPKLGGGSAARRSPSSPGSSR